eukprot:EC800169.1.p1 GENE.EC800169.1~~EC800169.1.p1  ORF type:complete len:169 (+),score=61.32 EC800169.1:320-826(+)
MDNTWPIPFATSDPFVVRKTIEIQADKSMPYFQYGHYLSVGGLFRLIIMALGFALVFLLAKFKLTRDLLRKYKSEGSGSSVESRQSSRSRILFLARDDNGKLLGQAEFTGADPYDVTAVTVVQAARVLLEKREQLPRRGGVATPVSALGDVYTDYLMRCPEIAFRKVE